MKKINKKNLFVILSSVLVVILAFVLVYIFGGLQENNLEINNEELKTTWYYEDGASEPINLQLCGMGNAIQ